MKGMVFCDFLEMVDKVFSPEVVENIIDLSNLPNKGAYTDIGTYDHKELLRLVSNLSTITGVPISTLEVEYGKYLFKKLYNRYTDIVQNANSTFNFLQQVDQHIHVEVLKLYPEAELPRFECTMLSPKSMTMKYSSNHPFADLAEGLIQGCADHYQEVITLKRQKLPAENNKINVELFTLLKQG